MPLWRWRARHGTAGQGEGRKGKAKRGEARQGEARRGEASIPPQLHFKGSTQAQAHEEATSMPARETTSTCTRTDALGMRAEERGSRDTE